MYHITYNNGFKTYWTVEETIYTLEDLADADKKLHWLHSDLSISDSNFLQRVMWRVLSVYPKFRNWVFDINLEAAKSILNQLKPQLKEDGLKDIFNRAVLKFSEIAPRYVKDLTTFDNTFESSLYSVANPVSRSMIDILSMHGLSGNVVSFLDRDDKNQLKLVSKGVNISIKNNCTTIVFREKPSLETIDLLQSYPNLVALDFSKLEEGVSDTDLLSLMPALLSLRSLKKLHFVNLSLSSNKLFLELAKLSSLKELVLKNCFDLTDNDLLALKDIQSLTYLDISYSDSITNKGLLFIAQMKGLTYLNLSFCSRISDRGIEQLKQLSFLKSLSIAACEKITDKALKQIAELKSIVDINISYCPKLTDIGLSYLKGLSALKSLYACGCYRLTNNTVKVIKAFTHLTVLHLADCVNINKYAASDLMDLANLKELNLCGCFDIDDEALEKIGAIIALEYLDLWGCGLTEAGIGFLSPLINLKKLLLSEQSAIDVELNSTHSFTGTLKNPALSHLKDLKVELYDRGISYESLSVYFDD